MEGERKVKQVALADGVPLTKRERDGERDRGRH